MKQQESVGTPRRPRMAVIGGSFSLAVLAWAVLHVSALNMNLPGVDKGYAPLQPIAFSHRLHGGRLKVQCKYCHSGVEKSRHAGIPSASTCMNCHRFVTASAQTLLEEQQELGGALPISNREAPEALAGPSRPRPVSPELQKLYAAVRFDPRTQQTLDDKPGDPIAWVRVYRLPDFVFFDHRRHVNVGVACRECHGAVVTMDRIAQVSDLTMGWCVNCHRAVNRGDFPSLKGRFASTDCSSCHY